MSRRRSVLSAAAILSALLVPPTSAAAAPQQEDAAPSLAISGLLFGDIYVVTSHHLEDAAESFGGWLRRAYLTADATSGDGWFSRIRLEANQSGEFERYRFRVAFKDLHIGFAAGEHRITAGLSPTPTIDLVERYWGLRSLEKTPLDLQRVASRDTGIAARGPLAFDGALRYRAMVGSGIGFGTESGDGYKLMGAISWEFSPGWIIDAYSSHERRPANTDRFTVQGFLGHSSPGVRFGLLYANQDRQSDPPLEVASVFLIWRLSRAASLVGRIDRLLEPSPSGDSTGYLPFDPTARATLFLGALEFELGASIRLTPGIEVIAYDVSETTGRRPATDAILRLTAFWRSVPNLWRIH
jgi:hypothetical protein